MSQPHVERIIGLLATDEGLRRRFTENPVATLKELMEKGMNLNSCEHYSLARLDPRALARFAEAVGARLQKVEMEGGSQ